MSKRKTSHRDQDDQVSDGDSDSSAVSLINVDFDFFDPNPQIDYHALKRLLSQLFSRDAGLLEVNELVDLVLSQPTVGTTIKTDGIESDPYALLTVVNMHVHHTHPSIKSLANYALQKTQSASSTSPDALAFHTTLSQLFNQTEKHVGLVISERLINMPVQVVPPMYEMLGREVKWACDDGEPYTFSHLLFISRMYHLSPDEESALMNSAPSRPTRPKPSSKKARSSISHPAGTFTSNSSSSPSTTSSTEDDGASKTGIYPFHPEDSVLAQYATHTLDYKLTTPSKDHEEGEGGTRPRDAFGLDVRGRMMLVEAGKWGDVVKRLGEVFGVGQRIGDEGKEGGC